MKTKRKKSSKKSTVTKSNSLILLPIILFALFYSSLAMDLPSQSGLAQVDNTTNPFSKDFRIVVCDGPRLPPAKRQSYESNPTTFQQEFGHPPPYVDCDFAGLMKQAQHLITLAMMIGVLAAIAGIVWAGALYLTGNPNKISRAHAIFPKIFWGFIIMLSAWFVVYQILAWLTDNTAFRSLLGG